MMVTGLVTLLSFMLSHTCGIKGTKYSLMQDAQEPWI